MKLRYQHLDWREKLNEMSREQAMENLFRELMLVFDGDVDQAMQYLEKNIAQFQEQLGFDPQEFLDKLRDQGLVEKNKETGGHSLSAAGTQKIRESCFDTVFGKLSQGGGGGHSSKKAGGRGEKTGVKKLWQAGDESGDIDYRESMLNAYRRGSGGLGDEDLVVDEREQTTSVATVMLIDISHSMTLYGEDRITPAKRVAIAYAEMQQRHYPRDAFHILLFGDDVKEISIADLPQMSNGPFHTNTCEALRRAVEILAKARQPNKRVIMITDGKPTALFTGKKDRYGDRELIINSSYGLDPQIVNATLQQGARLRRMHCDLNIFMVASDSYLESFIKKLVNVSGGQAFRATSRDLGAQVLQQIQTRSGKRNKRQR